GASGGNGTIRGFNPAPNSDQAQGGSIEINPVPPGAQWAPSDVVSGFLGATGTDLGIARQYLTPAYAKDWKPTRAATIIDTNPAVTFVVTSPHVTGGRVAAQVTLTSQHEATLTPNGTPGVFRLQTAAGPGPYQFRIELSEISGKWRINSIAGLNKNQKNRFLLITNADFLRDYQSRNLYFPVNPATSILVPYP